MTSKDIERVWLVSGPQEINRGEIYETDIRKLTMLHFTIRTRDFEEEYFAVTGNNNNYDTNRWIKIFLFGLDENCCHTFIRADEDIENSIIPFIRMILDSPGKSEVRPLIDANTFISPDGRIFRAF